MTYLCPRLHSQSHHAFTNGYSIYWPIKSLSRVFEFSTDFNIKDYHLTLKMASAQVVEKSVTNNRPSLDSHHPDDLFQSRFVTPGFKPFSYSKIHQQTFVWNLHWWIFVKQSDTSLSKSPRQQWKQSLAHIHTHKTQSVNSTRRERHRNIINFFGKTNLLARTWLPILDECFLRSLMKSSQKIRCSTKSSTST